MSNIYILTSTDGTLNITLKPGALNGPGGPNRDSDMRMYGSGALLWGEGVDENILRLAENFACDEKPGFPGIPLDETDLAVTGGPGPGHGITNPIIGQTWYNKTDEQLYMYNGTEWKKTNAVIVNITAPGTSSQGDLWYDLGTATECGNPTLKIYDPTHPDAAVDGWVKVTSDRLSVCGDDMGGILNMSIDGGTTRNKITNLGTPTNPYDAVHMDYVDTEIAGASGALTAHATDGSLHITARQNIFLDNAEICGMTSDAAASQLAADVCSISDRLFRTGDTMTDFLTLHSNPSLDMHAATKGYVDNQVGGQSAGAERYVSYFNGRSGSGGSPAVPKVPLNGDVATEGENVYIYANGWRQVFPAQYS